MHILFIYLGVLFGIFLEGEMVMLSSVIAAHHGYLNFWIVLSLGIVGTYSSDCFYFFLGRKKGKGWLVKNHKIGHKISIIDNKLEKYSVHIFIFYRFIYGFRSVTPVVIGASRTKTGKFLVYSAISIILWATVYSSIGYLFGEIIKSKLSYIEHIEKYIIGVFVLTGLVIIITFQIRKQKKSY